ncbi:MAG: hypothetical protein WAU91_11725, partial [Desulfatitalea sp.]
MPAVALTQNKTTHMSPAIGTISLSTFFISEPPPPEVETINPEHLQSNSGANQKRVSSYFNLLLYFL